MVYKLKDKGNFETLPEEALHIYEGNMPALQKLLAEGWDIQAPLQLGKYTNLLPLEIALIMDRLNVVKLLIEYGAELNQEKKPAFLLAVRYGSEETVRYVHQQGARVDLLNSVQSSAYQEAYYGNVRNIPVIQELGLDIRKYGGQTLRTAVSDHNMKIVTYMLEHGVDINFNEPDMVYPYRATPLTVAVRNNDMQMARFLIEHGADVTLAEQNGERPYIIAAANQNHELAAYLKSLEPSEFHDRSNKLYALQSYKLPQELIDFLSGDNLRLMLPENEFKIKYIDFLSLTDTVEMKVDRKKLLRLSAEVDQYSHILIVWHPGSKKIGYYDEEHLEFAPLAKFADFMADPVGVLSELF